MDEIFSKFRKDKEAEKSKKKQDQEQVQSDDEVDDDDDEVQEEAQKKPVEEIDQPEEVQAPVIYDEPVNRVDAFLEGFKDKKTEKMSWDNNVDNRLDRLFGDFFLILLN